MLKLKEVNRTLLLLVFLNERMEIAVRNRAISKLMM
jgi:hypothetical protein